MTIRIIKLIRKFSILTLRVCETVKHEVERREGGFFGMLLGSLVASVLVHMLTGRRVVTAGKEVPRLGTRYNNNGMGKYFSSASSFKQYRDY